MNYSLSEIEKMENYLRQKYSLFRENIDNLREFNNNLSLYWKSDDTNTYEKYKISFEKKYQFLMNSIVIIDKLITKLNEKKLLLQESTKEINSYFD